MEGTEAERASLYERIVRPYRDQVAYLNARLADCTKLLDAARQECDALRDSCRRMRRDFKVLAICAGVVILALVVAVLR
jgi:hypothetical protein